MRATTRRVFVAGPAGRIECAVDSPEGSPRGHAVIAHPHPQFGGTLDNKVVQTLARAFVELGATVPLAAVLDWARPQDLPLVVVPGAEHFFHRRLHLLRDIVESYCR